MQLCTGTEINSSNWFSADMARGDQSVLPGMLAKSFHGQSFASPLCPPACLKNVTPESKTRPCARRVYTHKKNGPHVSPTGALLMPGQIEPDALDMLGHALPFLPKQGWIRE